MSDLIHPVLLAGGVGSRLWPLSRKSYPKQFCKLMGETTLFQSSALRLTSSEIVKFAPHVTITNSDFRFIVVEQLQGVEIDAGQILIEPDAKNTGSAILAASIKLHATDQDAVLLVAPSDHVIPDINEFHKAVSVGLSYAQCGKLVTFGVRPTHAATGYGYIKTSAPALDSFGVTDVASFVEKPNFAAAKEMLEDDNYLWNAGIFLFRAHDLIKSFEEHAPETLRLVSEAVKSASLDLGFLRLGAEPWSLLDDKSIDVLIMEKAKNLVAVPYNYKWSDLGGWEAIWSESNPDAAGNVLSSNAHAIECTNTLIRSEDSNQHAVGIGLHNIIAITMPDAVLIADKNRSQDIKKVVNLLSSKDVSQAEEFPKDHRPWGWFESLTRGSGFHVKHICVNPGESLSLQSHNHRSEHWVVVQGTAKVTIDDQVKLVTEGQSVFVPLRSKHRMENPERLPLFVIEVQIGTYFGEDDIVRYSDVYARN